MNENQTKKLQKKERVDEVMRVLGLEHTETNEDKALKETFEENNECPYNICNGSGLIKEEGSTTAKKCKCLLERIMRQKVLNANINERYIGKDIDFYDDKTTYEIFTPKPIPDPIDGRLKDEKNEKVEKFIKRHYDVKTEKRTLKELLKSYAKKNLSLLNEGKDGVNLILSGDPANGKTSFAIAIGLYFLANDKTVYFTTTQNLIDQVFEHKKEVERITTKIDVLILDELFNEYHSSNGLYAQKRLMEILKKREELGLITICTSNGNPRDFYFLYGKAFMSLLNGTFFLFRLKREGDGRIEKMLTNYEKFNF